MPCYDGRDRESVRVEYRDKIIEVENTEKLQEMEEELCKARDVIVKLLEITKENMITPKDGNLNKEINRQLHLHLEHRRGDWNAEFAAVTTALEELKVHVKELKKEGFIIDPKGPIVKQINELERRLAWLQELSDKDLTKDRNMF